MAKKKIKRALKRVAKAAVPMLAIAGLGKAFMNARNQRKQMKDFLATEGGDISNMTPRPNMLDIAGPLKRQVSKMNPEMLADELMELNTGTDFGLGPLDGAKYGGRITKSGVKRRTKKFAKKKKQANKMRKK